MNVLLVEGRAYLRGLLSLWLRSGGGEVVEAGSQEAAFEALAESGPDLDVVVLGARVGGVCSLALRDYILGRYPSLPVVLTSAAARGSVEVQRLEARGLPWADISTGKDALRDAIDAVVAPRGGDTVRFDSLPTAGEWSAG